MRPTRHFFKFLGVSLGALALSLAACSRKATTRAPFPGDNGKAIENDVFSTKIQKSSLAETVALSLEETFFKNLKPVFASQNKNAGEVELLARTASKAAAARVVQKIEKKESDCAFTLFDMNSWVKCIIHETLSEDLSTAKGLRTLLVSALKDENAQTLGDLSAIRKLIDATSNDQLTTLAGLINQGGNVEKLLLDMQSSLNDIRSQVELLSDNSVRLDMPFLSAKFFEGKRFVMTTSLQQGGVGLDRVQNLTTHVVKLSINSDRLVITRPKNGLFNGSNGIDLVVGAYPIVKSLKSGDETFYQVDFSRPEDRRFLTTYLVGDEPGYNITADVIVPRVVHAEKEVKAELKSGLYFDNADKNLVLDELMLLNTPKAVFENDQSNDPGEVERSSLHPTVRMTQGFVAIDEANDSQFAQTQKLDLNSAASGLFQNIENIGKDDPYFTSSGTFEGKTQFDAAPLVNVRKYNVQKPIIFVIAANTPAVAIPVIKSAVNSYRKIFEKLAPAGTTPAHIEAITQAEFEKANSTAGLKFGDNKIVAADPRVNMIYWEDNPDFGSAWATTSINPFSGEVISADVMLTGTLWAKEGCETYLVRKWALKPGTKRVTPVPSATDHVMMRASCNQRLWKLGLLTPGNTPATDSLKQIDQGRVMAAIEAGDHETLQALGQEYGVLKAPLSPTEIMVSLTQFTNKAASRISTKELLTDSHDHSKKTSAHKARFATQSDCLLTINNDNSALMSNSGLPIISNDLVKSAEDAALAMVRDVIMHELGHTFGLRHNFVASTTPGELDASATPAFPVNARTDSIMDYNDNAIGVDAGAMADYTDESGALQTADFGLYDIFALGNIYGLDTSSFKLKLKPTFCSDRDINFFGNCQRFDFGKSYNEYLVQRMNLATEEMRVAIDADLIFPESLNRYSEILGSFERTTTSMWLNFVAGHQLWHANSQPAVRTVLLDEQNKLFYGAGPFTAEFLSNYKDRFGRDPIGVRQTLDTNGATWNFDPAAKPTVNIRTTLADIYREIALQAYLAAAKDFPAIAKKIGKPEMAVTGSIVDIGTDPLTGFASILRNRFLDSVMTTKGSPLEFTYFNGNDRVSGAKLVDCRGIPVRLTLDTPFFNYKSQFVAKQLTFDSKCNEGEAVESQSIMAIGGGQFELDELTLNLVAAALLEPGYSYTATAKRLHSDREVLIGLVNGTGTYPITDKATKPAGFLADFYQKVIDLSTR